MKIVGSDSGTSNKKLAIIIVSTIVSLAFLSVVGYYVFTPKDNDESGVSANSLEENEDEFEFDASKALDEKEKQVYEGQDIDIDKIKQRNKQTKKEIEESLSIQDMGKISQESQQSQRYSNIDIEKEIEKEEEKSKKSREEVEKLDTESEEITYGEVTNEDLGSLDQLVAASTVELKQSIVSVKRAIENNTLDPINNYDHHLLKESLASKSGGYSGEHSGIDSLTYGDYLNIAKYWLFYNIDSDFSWHMTSKSDKLYKNIVERQIYKTDFSNISSQIISIHNENAIRNFDYEQSAYDMVFSLNGQMYKGFFYIEDNMPRLLDIEKL